MNHIRDVLPKALREPAVDYDVDYFRREIPWLVEHGVSDHVIERQRPLLLEYLRQQHICERCTGFESCGKEGDMKGFSQVLETYGPQLTVGVHRCQPFVDYLARKRVERWIAMSGALPEDSSYRFSNFPLEQRRKYPRLLRYAEQFAETFEPGMDMAGLYIFGPPGVGKTHLALAVVNRLLERGVPCLFARSDTIFDKMRHIIADNGDLEPMLDAYATVPVLVIDEFAQERANEFTLEKLFRIVNHRFHAKLPTWFTSNYAPPDVYRKNGVDIHDSTGPLRSRVMQMTKLARMDGDDARQRHLESLT